MDKPGHDDGERLRMTSELTTQRWVRGSAPAGLGLTMRKLKGTHRWILPNRGWVTFLLSLITVTSVVWSVESADWALRCRVSR